MSEEKEDMVSRSQPCADAQERSPAKQRSGGVCRVDFEDDGFHIDDIAISGDLIDMFRLEGMDRDQFWGAVYLKDGRDLRLWFDGSKARSLKVTAEWEGRASSEEQTSRVRRAKPELSRSEQDDHQYSISPSPLPEGQDLAELKPEAATNKPPVPLPAQGVVWAKCPTTCAKGAGACLAAGRCLQEGTPVQTAGIFTVSTGGPMTDWKCCGCGKPSPDQRRNCECPTAVLYRPGTRDSALKIEPDTTEEDRKARTEASEAMSDGVKALVGYLRARAAEHDEVSKQAADRIESLWVISLNVQARAEAAERQVKEINDLCRAAEARAETAERERDEALSQRNAARMQNHVFISERNEAKTRAEAAERERDYADQRIARMVVEGVCDAELVAAEATITSLQAQLARAREALEAAREKFAEYADLHYRKQTPDGDARGAINAAFANMCRASLSEKGESQ